MSAAGASVCRSGCCPNCVLLGHGAGSRDAPSTRPPASVRACRQTSVRRYPPCRRNRRYFSPEPAPVECVQPTARRTWKIVDCQPWCYSFSIRPVREYTARQRLVGTPFTQSILHSQILSASTSPIRKSVAAHYLPLLTPPDR